MYDDGEFILTQEGEAIQRYRGRVDASLLGELKDELTVLCKSPPLVTPGPRPHRGSEFTPFVMFEDEGLWRIVNISPAISLSLADRARAGFGQPMEPFVPTESWVVVEDLGPVTANVYVDGVGIVPRNSEAQADWTGTEPPRELREMVANEELDRRLAVMGLKQEMLPTQLKWEGHVWQIRSFVSAHPGGDYLFALSLAIREESAAKP